MNEQETYKNNLTKLCMQLMSDGLTDKSYDMLEDWLQCKGEMELAVRLSRMKTCKKKELETKQKRSNK